MLNDQLLLHDCEFIIIIIDIGNMSFSMGFFFSILSNFDFWRLEWAVKNVAVLDYIILNTKL